MTILKLPKNTIINNGKFFQQVTEAANRGCILKWDKNYEYAYQTLDTIQFITDDLVKAIVESGGDVYNYNYYLDMNMSDYNEKEVPNEILEYLNLSNDNNTTYKYCDLFNFTVNSLNETQDVKNINVLNSVNNELLPMSLTLQLESKL